MKDASYYECLGGGGGSAGSIAPFLSEKVTAPLNKWPSGHNPCVDPENTTYDAKYSLQHRWSPI